MHKISIATLAVLTACMPLLAAAASLPTPPTDGAIPAPLLSMPAGTTDCFQYYSFGSVQANIHADNASAVSGAPVSFSGSLTNNNSYPIVDGSLYVKVLRERGSEKDVNGPDVVDQYFVRQGIALPAHGSMPIAFTWDIPSYEKSGSYSVATFFTTAKKFNLLGLSFTDDVVGNTASFSVSGELQNDVSFDKTSVTVAGRPYHFAAFAPSVDTSAAVPVSAIVQNTTDKPTVVTVDWDLYYWDAQLLQNRVAHSEVPVRVAAGGTAPVVYTATDTQYPVYLLVGTLHWGNTQSIINVRFVRSGIDRTRINFPGVTAYPLRAGHEATLFSCLHNAGQSASVPDGKLVLSLTDQMGNIIHEYTYAGDVTGAMMGVADKFTPKMDYGTFNISAKLYRGGQLVDQTQISYDCKAIDPSLCSPQEAAGTPSALGSLLSSFGLAGVFAVVGVLILLACLFFVFRPKRHPPSLPPTASPGI